MRIETAPQDDFAFGLSECLPEVVDVKAKAHLTLEVQFADGLTGLVHFEPSHLTGVFEVLQDPGFFQRVVVSHGAVTWPGELDLAPDAMYEAIQRSREWVLQ